MPNNEMSEIQKEATELQSQGTAMEQIAKSFIITSNDTYEQAGAALVKVKERRKEIMAKPLQKKADAHGVWSFLNDICKMIDAPFARTEDTWDLKMSAWRREIKRKQAEEDARAAAKALKDAEDKRKKDLAAAKKQGDKEGLEQLKAAPLEVIVAPPKIQAPPKIDGIVVRKVRKWRYTDPKKVPCQYHMIDEVAIGKVVRALGANHGIPGIAFYEEDAQ